MPELLTAEKIEQVHEAKTEDYIDHWNEVNRKAQERQDQLMRDLSAPFDVTDIEWLPNPGTGQAFAYVEVWKYKDRLNRLLPFRWSEGQPVITMTDKKVAVSVEVVVDGVPYGGAGEEDTSNHNAVTVAYSQAFRRACASFGMGRYMYDFDTTWVHFDDKKRIVENKLLLAIAAYRKLGIYLDKKYENMKITPTEATSSRPTQQVASTSSPTAHAANPSTPASNADGRVGNASKAQAYRMREKGLTDGEIAALGRDQVKTVMDMIFKEGATLDEINSYLAQEEEF